MVLFGFPDSSSRWSLRLVSYCFVVLGICGTFEGGLQSEQQCPYWLASHCSGHCYSHRYQPGDAEEEAIWHHQPWDCGGKDWAGFCLGLS